MAFRVQERDLDLAQLLNKIGLGDTPMFAQHVFPDCSDRVRRRRLAILVANGILARLTIGEYHNGNGRIPYVYGLTEKGAEILAERRDVAPRQLVTDTNSPRHVAHSLAVSQFILKLLKACQALGLEEPKLIFEYDLTEQFKTDPQPTTPYQQRYILHEKFTPSENGNGTPKPFSCRADASFLFCYQEYTFIGYLEADRSTEPRSVIRAKARAFHHLINVEHRYRKHWPNMDSPSIRVFFMTRNKRRMHSLLSFLAGCQGAELFRFAVADKLTQPTILTAPVWHAVDRPNEPRPIIITESSEKERVDG